MAKPLLFLDIDGVLNPVLPSAEFTAYDILDYTVLLSAGTRRVAARTVRRLRAHLGHHLGARGQPSHSPAAGPAGAARSGVQPLPAAPRGSSAAARGTVLGPQVGADPAPRGGRPFAWTDDVIPRRLARQARFRRDRVLLRVNPAHGLNRGHVDRLLSRGPVPTRSVRLARRESLAAQQF
ncbi:hypothetical protein QMK19_24380 [Streptomyces sp. H10-C2]|uniref:hypothetical protein n=1 Tax=unclassified Streptomyces TaxID=2593676 RepID=UPI0024B88B3B|nr:MULTISPECIES: hypothetical protein [unclassified Streptomyces]MDJ0343105.1 hypothetical protein [Streptomyces sp. PH10-H1]MDJ0372715.1 hypothetical protein [Streptomyces sp. H10-C2]